MPRRCYRHKLWIARRRSESCHANEPSWKQSGAAPNSIGKKPGSYARSFRLSVTHFASKQRVRWIARCAIYAWRCSEREKNWTTRARGFGRGVPAVIGGSRLEVLDIGLLEAAGGRMTGAAGMLEVVSGVAGFCSEFTCALSTAS